MKVFFLAASLALCAQWPMRQSSVLFAGLALNQRAHIDLWKTLPADSSVDIRNFSIRQPVLWVY